MSLEERLKQIDKLIATDVLKAEVYQFNFQRWWSCPVDGFLEYAHKTSTGRYVVLLAPINEWSPTTNPIHCHAAMREFVRQLYDIQIDISCDGFIKCIITKWTDDELKQWSLLDSGDEGSEGDYCLTICRTMLKTKGLDYWA